MSDATSQYRICAECTYYQTRSHTHRGVESTLPAVCIHPQARSVIDGQPSCCAGQRGGDSVLVFGTCGLEGVNFVPKPRDGVGDEGMAVV